MTNIEQYLNTYYCIINFKSNSFVWRFSSRVTLYIFPQRVPNPLNIRWNMIGIFSKIFDSWIWVVSIYSNSIVIPRSPIDTLHNLIRRIFSHTSFHSLENLSRPSSEDWGSWNILIISVLFYVQASRLDAFCPSQKMWFYR